MGARRAGRVLPDHQLVLANDLAVGLGAAVTGRAAAGGDAHHRPSGAGLRGGDGGFGPDEEQGEQHEREARGSTDYRQTAIAPHVFPPRRLALPGGRPSLHD